MEMKELPPRQAYPAEPVRLERRPVAFRVMGHSGWMLFEREESAREASDALGVEYQGLYVRDGR
jgi:hypothetical protein